MALPALEKTYQFSLNNLVPAAAGTIFATDANTDRKQLMFDIVDKLNDLGGSWTVPWHVEGSSDSINAAMDGPTNRWAAPANCIWNSDGLAHSWIVLSNVGLGMEICIDLVCSVNTEGGAIRMLMSANGFGAANGGTDGSITQRPTATDECELRDGGSDLDGAWSGLADGAPRQYRWNIVGSTDGEVWNVLIYYNARLVGFWRLETPKNPPAGWTTPGVFQALGDNSDIVEADDDSRTGTSGDGHVCCLDPVRRGTRAGQQISGSSLGTRTPVHPYSWGISGSGFLVCKNSNSPVHPITGNPIMYPVWWWTAATSMGRGRLGSAYDLWYRTNPSGGAVGDTYPANPATPQFIVAGFNWIIPWDGATVPIVA